VQGREIIEIIPGLNGREAQTESCRPRLRSGQHLRRAPGNAGEQGWNRTAQGQQSVATIPAGDGHNLGIGQGGEGAASSGSGRSGLSAPTTATGPPPAANSAAVTRAKRAPRLPRPGEVRHAGKGAGKPALAPGAAQDRGRWTVGEARHRFLQGDPVESTGFFRGNGE